MRLADSEAFELLLINYMNNPCISEDAKYVLDVVLDMAKANPTVEGVPVVRCKDCKYSLKWMTGIVSGEEILQCYVWGVDTYPRAYEYCSRGVRREDNETD